MRAKPYLILTMLVAALMIGLVLLDIFCAQRNFQATISAQDKAYQFRFLKITRGTNHVVYSGDSASARLKRVLGYSGIGPITRLAARIRAQMYLRTTPTNAAVLWLGWTHKDYAFATTNGFPDVACSVCQPDGRKAQMRFVGGFQAPLIKEIAGAWELPEQFRPFSGCVVYLEEYKEQPHRLENVATIRLQ